ncbi:MAG TPA: FGGY-family carbohydrate kinase [Candidatus Ratteibacteria bacterium]|jgi:sugar (pentulose or hexulose) kinase|uniref:Xylulose kinase n=1 Tax=candidate division TA06 bacterium ADurb.Bin131 TaxID=1852827 RepID=A0A1V6CE57_UNCT6|nr:MAG: Xylulose kinase [candidate division TA06 bacterium ADurb.Bin131]HOC02158.1 FGGY-family carbohydrate kinase [bacterium]HRS06520.1 FGGY-family carbohydrate kinase [Candidatus Ratteibacteria bacterium]HON05934.1 FGGY-family carbohydrate kinase [bacterium]HPC28894.1 FGGY-family carbohydrate kinase [bacterium]
MDKIFLGIDVGTQGTRVVCVDSKGEVISESEDLFPLQSRPLPDGWHQQDPYQWWQSTVLCLRKVLREINISSISAISASSTSGTICLLDEKYLPVMPAILYSDRRGEDQAIALNKGLYHITEKMGYKFNSSYALAKILWVKENMPEVFSRVKRVVHATDYLIGKLSGNFCVSDYTNVLKTGYDLIDGAWPGEIESIFGIPVEILPEVVSPGAVIGVVSVGCSEETGLPPGIPVVAGMTDGCASQVSTGTVTPGDWNSTLGTTLVIKGVTKEILKDPFGRIYSHRHPDGYWLPGGASNTGGEYITKKFSQDELDELNNNALKIAPTGLLCYPLSGKGERFPFVNPQAEGFEPAGCDKNTLYTSCLEGVGYIEKLAYQTLEDLRAKIGEKIRIAGGGTKSVSWNKIRASILGKILIQPQHTGAAIGSAIISSSRTYFQNLVSACENMVKITATYEPEKNWVDRYNEIYQKFIKELKLRNYI